MNCTIYLFGEFGHGVTSSVNDYTKSIFEEFISKANAPTQIIIHRREAIMNYGYVRQITDNHLFGICVQINGQYMATTKKLFTAFENIIANIAVRGDILYLNKNGDLEATISHFTDKPEEVENAVVNCMTEISKLSPTCKSLPDIDFSTTNCDINLFNENDNSQTIINTSVKNGYTFIYKEQDYDTLALSGYRSTLYNLNKENEDYKKKVKELEKEQRILKREKKQMGVVIVLFVALFVGSIIFFNTIEEKNEDIANKQETIERQKVEKDNLIEEKDEILNKNTQLQNRNADLTIKQESTRKELENIKYEHDKLKIEHERLKTVYKSKEQENAFYKTEISSLTSKNRRLESKLDEAQKDLTQKDAAYKILLEKYDRTCQQLTTMENTYYSTKEGKKAIRKYSK